MRVVRRVMCGAVGVGWTVLAAALMPVPARAQTPDSAGVVRGRVTAPDGRPIAGGSVQVEGTTLRSVTAPDGRYRISNVPPGVRVLVARRIGYRLARVAVTVTPAGATQDVTLAEAPFQLEGVTVSVGTRGANRTVLESPVPVDVLSARDLVTTGAVQTAEVIQALVPSFTQPRIVRGDGSETVRPATLRGLGTDQLLVLVNGRRRHVSAHLIGDATGVDLNTIPAGAIDRIEVLRDGAAAQYGSDAIAGVINVVLKDNGGGRRFSVTGGQTTRGDGATGLASLNGGVGLGRRGGFLNVTGELLGTEQVRRAGPDLRQQYFGTVRDSTGRVLYSDPRGDSLNAAWAANPRVTMLEGDPRRVAGSLYYNARLPLRPALSLYSFGGYTNREVRNGSCRFREPKADGVVRAIYPNGFLARGLNATTDLAGTAGVRADAGGGSWDLSVGYGGSSFEYNLQNSNNPSLGAASPRDFYLGTHRFEQVAGNLDFVRAVDLGLPSPVTVALGSEVRGEHYEIRPGEPASYEDGGVPIMDGPNAGRRAPAGSQCYVGYRPSNTTDTWRSNAAAYVDLESNVTRALLLGVAGRAERYSDFGSTVNGKIAARFEPVRGYALRAAANTGFRAPSLQQSHFSQTQTNFLFDAAVGQIVSRENSTFRLRSVAAEALGASPLEPERSTNVSAGVTATPVGNVAVSVDHYDITVRDRIVRTSFFSVNNPKVKALFDASGVRDIQAGRFFTNAVDVRTRGWDVVLQSGVDLASAGRTQITAGYNRTKNTVLRVAGTPPELAGLEETIFNASARRGVERASPRGGNLSLTLTHDVGDVSLLLRTFRYGKWVGSDPEEERPGVNVTPAMWYTDVDLAYRLRLRGTRTLTLALGGTNVFDTMPPEAGPDASFFGNFRYVNGANSAFGVNGAYLYARVVLER